MKLRHQILLFFLLFALVPLITAVLLNLPLVLERMELFYHKAHLQNLRADFRDLDQHLASRDEMVKLLAKLPEPGSVLGNRPAGSNKAIDTARARYTEWINHILRDQLDIIEILFLDTEGGARFWLERDIDSQEWQPTLESPPLPNPRFFEAALKGQPGNVLVSTISLDSDAGANDPRRYMTLHLASPIADRQDQTTIGGITITVDVGGIASFYQNTLWVHDNGHFVEHAGPAAQSGNAFERFPGLEKIFREGKAGLWKGRGKQIMWIPMFRTEQSGPLWVGRWVDPSPIAEFRNALTLRVLSIVLALSLAIWFAARWVAQRAGQISQELVDGVESVLQDKQGVAFAWKGPRELKKLGDSLSQLAAEHGRNLRDLRTHAQQLEESNRYKSQFLANVSHELRTPLNSILLLSKMLADTQSGLTDEQKQQARVIHQASTDLRNLIDDILNLSRIEAQRIGFNLEQIDLPQLLQELIELVQPQFEAKRLPLELLLDEDAPHQIYTDPEKVRQILKNFLSNALKFTERGKVSLRLSGCRDTDYFLKICVQDSGIGIPKAQQGHVFEAFKQADGSTSRRYGGTGLGLTISQQLAKLLGGTIELDSNADQGSTFSLLLPREFDASDVADSRIEISEEPRRPADEPGQQTDNNSADRVGQRVLLVAHEVQTLLTLTPLLEQWGLDVTAAGDGAEALEVLEEDEAFSILLIDSMMPHRDGYDTIERIHHDQRFDDLVIIAITTDGGAEEREGCLSTGADDCIARPVDSDELKQLIARHLP